MIPAGIVNYLFFALLGTMTVALFINAWIEGTQPRRGAGAGSVWLFLCWLFLAMLGLAMTSKALNCILLGCE